MPVLAMPELDGETDPLLAACERSTVCSASLRACWFGSSL